ncbi:MAG: Gfo/Idh/MocA family protein [Kiloniellaceae bacterium]
MERVAVGLIGTGFMGKCCALAFGSVTAVFGPPLRPELELLCDIDAEAAEKLADQFGFKRWTDDWRVLVVDPAVDVVVITAPNALHKAMALAAISAGKHVYCEKPMSLTLADATEMAAAAARADVKTLVGYSYLRNPAVGYARRLIEAGEIGEIVSFRGVCDEDYMAGPDRPRTWRCRVEDAGTGTLGDLASHLISVAQYLVGPVDAVCGQTETVYKRRPIPGRPGETGPVENEDMASALVRFANGVTGTFASSRIAWGRKNHLAWEVNGTRGAIAFDQERMNELRLFRADETAADQGFRTILTGPQHPPYGQFCPAPGHGLGFNEQKVVEVAHLLNGLAGLEPLYPDFDDALGIERVIHAIAASAKTRNWVGTRRE